MGSVCCLLVSLFGGCVFACGFWGRVLDFGGLVFVVGFTLRCFVVGVLFSVRPVCFGLSFGVAVWSFGWYLFVCLLRWVCFAFIGWVGCFCGCA